ncbi:GNAT family N-acetyltransferase [Paracoccus lichenicola]|uniref:GNAT family N-acetyltransferase n=1 Tax=Paracoccus lichenicola TaxID=2665644 RepID=UPI0018AC2AE9
MALGRGGRRRGYLAPEPGPGAWNLLFLGVRPEARRRGVARALVAEVERRLRPPAEPVCKPPDPHNPGAIPPPSLSCVIKPVLQHSTAPGG